MKKRRWIVVGTTLISASATTLVGLGDAVATAADDPLGTVVMSGYLIGDDGGPLSGRTLDFYGLKPDVQDPLNGDISTVPAGSGHTDANGYYRVTIDVEQLPRNSAGGVPIEAIFRSSPGEIGLIYDFVAHADPESPSGWSVQYPGDALARVNMEAPESVTTYLQVGTGLLNDASELNPRVPAPSSTVADLPGLSMNTSTMTAPPDEVQPEDGAEVGASQPAPFTQEAIQDQSFSVSRSHAPQTSCPTNFYMKWDYKEDYRYIYAPDKYFNTSAGYDSIWKYSRTHETTLGISTDSGGRKYQGGMSASAQQTTGITVEATAGPNQQRHFARRWQYRKQRAYCISQYSSWGESPTVIYLDVTRFVPYRLMSGSKWIDTTANFTCPPKSQYPENHSEYGGMTTVSRNTAVTYGGYFKVRDVKLDLRQEDRSEQSFTIAPRLNKTANVCGSDADPAFASFIKGK